MEVENKLKVYSLGIVVEDKPDKTDIILVSPVETLNIQPNGKILDYKMKFKGELKNVDGKGFTTEMQATNYLRAKWIPIEGSNRISAPDVIKNETVLIYKFGDINTYYWSTIFREPEIRRLETVLYAYSNMKEPLKAFDKESSYWIEWSTKEKWIHLHTSKNDGEFTIYDCKINTKEGYIEVKDDEGNQIKLDSKNNSITMEAVKEITLKAPDIYLDGKVWGSETIIDSGGNTNHHSHGW